MQRIVNIPRVDDPSNHPDYIGRFFKVHFALGSNAVDGSYSLLVGAGHRTETIYHPAKKFHTPIFLTYELCKTLPIRVIYNEEDDGRTARVNINDALPSPGTPLSYSMQFKTEVEVELDRKTKVSVVCYFALHTMNYNPLSYTTFDLITQLKQSSRLAFLDKVDYTRVFIYAVSNNYVNWIKDNPQLRSQPESINSFQEQGYLLYITPLSDEQTKSCLYSFIEFDNALLQFALLPKECLHNLNTTHQSLPFLPVSTYDDAIYLRFELRNDADEVLGMAQEAISTLLQPFASMQRLASRELAPVTVGSIGSNRLQQQLIYNHHVLNSQDKLVEPSVSSYQRKSKTSTSRTAGGREKRKKNGGDDTWQAPDCSEQSQHHVLKQPQANPPIGQQSLSDGAKQLHGPHELPLFDAYPPLFSSTADKAKTAKAIANLKTRGSLYISCMTHCHLPTMADTFGKNNIILKPSVVLDYYSDDNRKNEMDKTVDIIGNIAQRMEPFFTYRRIPHTSAEVDEFFSRHYDNFRPNFVGDNALNKTGKLIDPEAQIAKEELQRELEPGEPYILRNIEAAGIPVTFLNISPPPNLTPARDVGKIAGYKDKYQQLSATLRQKYPNKPEWQRYEFNNLMRAGNNAFPSANALCNGLSRRGIVSCDNSFHRQLMRDGQYVDEYSCDIFDGRRLHALLDLNTPNVNQNCDYPLSVEQMLYYCRVVKMKLRSSVLPLPEDFAQRRQEKMSGRIRANDNNSGAGAKTHQTYVQEFARELIIRLMIDVETKVYKNSMIEYHVVFVGGYRDDGKPETKQELHRLLREYCAMLPVSFVFVEYNEKTTQRDHEGQDHTNGGALLDQEGVQLLNETGMLQLNAPKYYAMQMSEKMYPIFTYDRRHLHKLQQEYLYPQRDMIIGVRKSWFLDQDTKVYDYDKIVLPLIKQRLALQVKQYLDIQFKSRCTFENMAQIMYPSPPGVLNLFEVQTAAPMKMFTQCAFFSLFFAAEGNDNKLDNNKPHKIISFEEEQILKQQNRCPRCQVVDHTMHEAIDMFYQQARINSQNMDEQNDKMFGKYIDQEFVADTAEETDSQSCSVAAERHHTTEPPPPFMDDIVDTSKFNIKLDHIATTATVRDVCNNMQWHIENLALKLAQFKEQQGL